jgi:hypothetical protein
MVPPVVTWRHRPRTAAAAAARRMEGQPALVRRRQVVLARAAALGVRLLTEHLVVLPASPALRLAAVHTARAAAAPVRLASLEMAAAVWS